MDRRPSRREVLRAGALGAGGLAAGVVLPGCVSQPPSKNLAFSRDTIAYGTEPMQQAELTVPLLGKPRPVVILLHGGYWRLGFDRSEMVGLATDLSRLGYAAWNVDYRRMGEGGGWPGTFEDVALAVDKLDEVAAGKNLDLNRVVAIGHSAGSQLAMWVAARPKALVGQLGAQPKVAPKAVVSLSGVLDLAAVANSDAVGRLGELKSSVLEVLGGAPAQVPDRYAQMSPVALLPLAVPRLLVHGIRDDRVPIEQSRAFVTAAAKVNEPTQLVELPDVDHFDVVKPDKAWWDSVVSWLATTNGDPLG